MHDFMNSCKFNKFLLCKIYWNFARIIRFLQAFVQCLNFKETSLISHLLPVKTREDFGPLKISWKILRTSQFYELLSKLKSLRQLFLYVLPRSNSNRCRNWLEHPESDSSVRLRINGPIQHRFSRWSNLPQLRSILGPKSVLKNTKISC